MNDMTPNTFQSGAQSLDALVVQGLGGEAFTTTLAIAEGTQNDHASVIKLVRTYEADLSEFGGVGFEIRPFETAGGKQQREIALLNEPQSTLLLTYMRNSEVVRVFKKRLVKAFYELKALTANAFRIPKTMSEALRLAADNADRADKAEAALTIAQPKVDALDRLESSEGCLNVRLAAKMLDMPERKFTKWLEANRWAFRQNGIGTLQAHVEKRNAGYLDHRPHTFFDQARGEERTVAQMVITPKGLAKLATKFASGQGGLI